MNRDDIESTAADFRGNPIQPAAAVPKCRLPLWTLNMPTVTEVLETRGLGAGAVACTVWIPVPTIRDADIRSVMPATIPRRAGVKPDVLPADCRRWLVVLMTTPEERGVLVRLSVEISRIA